MTKSQNSFDQNGYNLYVQSYNDFSDIKFENAAVNEEEKEYSKLLQRLKQFDKIHTIQEARLLAEELFHIKNEVNYIKAGNAFCTIKNTAKRFQIVVNNNEEVICYSYKEKNK